MVVLFVCWHTVGGVVVIDTPLASEDLVCYDCKRTVSTQYIFIRY